MPFSVWVCATVVLRFDRGACFLCLVLERADAVAEFVGEGWFGVTVEEFLVFDDFAELGEPVA